ncbi:hypothetical protein CDAR_448531 [Caerostris darwini]|uniref:Uncharacterized protein n=1 Tax=Caerostris darwini TaxID=1538125 RepID=A0AAV4QKY3_9ARAC|nr:hypothetical protein CDAR_448531 [Caerostris darwini]
MEYPQTSHSNSTSMRAPTEECINMKAPPSIGGSKKGADQRMGARSYDSIVRHNSCLRHDSNLRHNSNLRNDSILRHDSIEISFNTAPGGVSKPFSPAPTNIFKDDIWGLNPTNVEFGNVYLKRCTVYSGTKYVQSGVSKSFNSAPRNVVKDDIWDLNTPNIVFEDVYSKRCSVYSGTKYVQCNRLPWSIPGIIAFVRYLKYLIGMLAISNNTSDQHWYRTVEFGSKPTRKKEANAFLSRIGIRVINLMSKYLSFVLQQKDEIMRIE